MKELPTYIALVDSFRKLPGVGSRSAERMASSVLGMPKEDVDEFAKALQNATNKIHKCPNCGLFTEDELCDICSDSERDRSVCLVVGTPKEAVAFEGISGFNGTYHVLGGLLAPQKGIGPDSLRIADLQRRIKEEGIKEIIVATSPTIEGETTALFLAKILEPLEVKVSRIGYGLPVGSNLEYADSLTLAKALDGRKPL